MNKILEFLGMAVNILIMLNKATAEKYPCILVLGKNTLAIGWLFRSSRIGPNLAYFQTV